jgi:site-specific recombinase XerD
MQTDTLELPIGKPTSRTRRNPRGVYEKFSGSGEWWIRYVDASGRYRREKAGTKSAAINLFRKRKNDALQGKKLPEALRRATVLFAEIARDALVYSRREKRSYKDDEWRMETLLGWFRDQQADSITPQQIEAKFAESIEEKGWAASTVNHHRSLLSLVYRLGIRNRKVSVNPAREVTHRREDNSRVRFLTPKEEERLRKVLLERCPEHIAEMDLALNTGLRLGCMYDLTWEMVDLPRRMVNIPRTKNEEPLHLPLNDAAVSALSVFLKRGDGTGAVIRNGAGTPLTGCYHWFIPAVREAGIANFKWHDFRHTFASRLRQAGVPLETIAELLGHKGLAMTMRYAHLAVEHLYDAVQRLTPQPTDTTTDTSPTYDVEAHRPTVQ